jgi:hypothetical protein
LITRGPIWTTDRFRAIWRLNAGSDAPVLADYGSLALKVDAHNGAWTIESADGIELWERGAQIDLRPACTARRVELQADGPATYVLRYSQAGHVISEQVFDTVATQKGLSAYARVPLSPGRAFDRVELRLARGTHPAVLRKIRFGQ